jgi:isoquinoline 1-oxidoreductase beta subunit
MQRQNGTDRRQFMIRAAGAASGAWLALELPVAEAIERQDAGLPLPPTAWRSSAWLTMQPDGSILVTVHKAEMGQGVLTALPMLIAEELALPMSRVAAVLAPAADEFRDERGNQSTGYSSSIRTSYLPFRTLGATARELLLAAAAREWQADPTRLRVQDGYVVDPANSARRVPFSALLESARTLAVPVKPTLKDSLQFRLLGTRPTRLDTPSKIDGSALFGIDFKLPGMKVAVLERTPTFDGVLSDVDDAAALAIPGVVSVRVLPVGVAVIADSFWAAQRGRAALKIDWDPGANEAQNSAQHERELTGPMTDQGQPARVRGDVDRLRRDPENRWLVADYFAPFLAHAALEPIATTVWFHDGLCEIWVGTQAPSRAQDAAMKVTGLPRERVKVNCLQIGGSFGRRGERDYITEAVTVARSMPATPIKLIWSREDDMRADFYRPASAHRVAGCVNPRGELIGLAHRVVAPSVARRRAPEMLTTGHDFLLTQGSDDSLYDIPHLRVDYHELDLGVPVGFWRSVGHSYNVFVIESFIDEMAALAKRDPLDLRLELLRNEPRMLRVLRAAAAAAGWGRKLGAGMGLGMACSKSYETRVAVVAEIKVEGASWRATRLWCAVDCGSVVHPGQVEQQIQGGLVFGLTAAMYGEITFDKGAVKQANFDAYPLLAMSAMPRIEVQLMASDESPTGVGEPATPVIAPAVANALFATSGQRLRRMPLKLKEPPKEAAKSPSTLRRPVTDR